MGSALQNYCMWEIASQCMSWPSTSGANSAKRVAKKHGSRTCFAKYSHDLVSAVPLPTNPIIHLQAKATVFRGGWGHKMAT